MENETLQPIETAPKDGTKIYIWGGRFMSCDTQDYGMPHDGPSPAIYLEARNPKVDPPWLLLDAHIYVRIKDPSHWTPL